MSEEESRPKKMCSKCFVRAPLPTETHTADTTGNLTRHKDDPRLQISDVCNTGIQEARRACAQDDSLCTWRFLMDTHVAAKTDVTFVVRGPGASRNSGEAQNVGDFTFTSGYDAAGFTTFAAVDNRRGLIAFPAYSDAHVADGRSRCWRPRLRRVLCAFLNGHH